MPILRVKTPTPSTSQPSSHHIDIGKRPEDGSYSESNLRSAYPDSPCRNRRRSSAKTQPIGYSAASREQPPGWAALISEIGTLLFLLC